MDEKHVNASIGCDVKDCRYHCQSRQYCSLDSIHVANQNGAAHRAQDTVCGSFECRKETTHGGVC